LEHGKSVRDSTATYGSHPTFAPARNPTSNLPESPCARSVHSTPSQASGPSFQVCFLPMQLCKPAPRTPVRTETQHAFSFPFPHRGLYPLRSGRARGTCASWLFLGASWRSGTPRTRIEASVSCMRNEPASTATCTGIPSKYSHVCLAAEAFVITRSKKEPIRCIWVLVGSSGVAPAELDQPSMPLHDYCRKRSRETAPAARETQRRELRKPPTQKKRSSRRPTFPCVAFGFFSFWGFIFGIMFPFVWDIREGCGEHGPTELLCCRFRPARWP
jgi:hypothetical protein